MWTISLSMLSSRWGDRCFFANAGFAYWERIQEPDWSRMEAIFQTHVFSPIYAGERMDSLYHSLLPPYLNIGLLEPWELIEAVQRAYDQGRAPINSTEGFVRQVQGWRE
jgi:hypothetical protein